MPLMDLPPEVIIEMLSCINTQADLRAISRTCKKLRFYNEAFQWQSLHVIIKRSSDPQVIPLIDKPKPKPTKFFKIVAENAPGRLLEACNQGRIPCENVRQIRITSLSGLVDHSKIQSDCNKMLTKFPRLKHLYLKTRPRGQLPQSPNVMVLLATLTRLPHLKTLRISGISSSNEVYPPVPGYLAYIGDRASNIEVLHISIPRLIDNTIILALLAWPRALRHLNLELSDLLQPGIPALFAAIARHGHTLESLVISIGRLLDPTLTGVVYASPEYNIYGWDFSTFTSISSLAIQMPPVLDQNIVRRLPPRLKHLQLECNVYLENMKSSCFICLADEKRGKLSCLETITCWQYEAFGSVDEPQSLQDMAMIAEIGEALGRRGVVFTYSGKGRSRFATG